jgi:hypothetical protein
MVVADKIRLRINEMWLGVPFSSSVLLDLSTRAAVDQSLSRMVKAGELVRVARGIFARPKENRYVGRVMPSPLSVAEAAAKATGATVDFHGAEALRRFGLTTQVPTQAVFYTTGPSRRFKVGQMEVRLRHVAARKLALAGRPAGLGLSALWYLGRNAVTREVINTIAERLGPDEFRALSAAKASMPAWMADAIHRHERSSSHG